MTALLSHRPGVRLPRLTAALTALLFAVAAPATLAQDDGAFDAADPGGDTLVITDEPVVVVEPTGADESAYAIDNLLLFVCAVLVLFMQAGFAMVEAGFNASKHTVNILFKNALDISVGVLLYFLVGYNLMYTDAPIVDNYLGSVTAGVADLEDGSYLYRTGPNDDGKTVADGNLNPQVDFLFQVAFAATAATIVSGAVAGRMKFGAYVIYSAVLTGFIYPISGYWKWGGGWLNDMGFYDFAGSAVVHAVGGFAGLAGALVLGPRLGRYTPDGKPVAIPGHSLPLATLGVFILLIGWFGFNPGSQLSLYGADDTDMVMKIAVNTLLAAAAGAVVSTILSWGLFGKPDLSMALNGLLGGLVGITANCDGVSNVSAIVIGAVAGALVVAAIIAMDKVRIDDPVGAFPVHGVCGMWGCLAIAVFPTNYATFLDPSESGAPMGNAVAQVVGTLSISAWAFVTMFALFFLLKLVGFLRVSAEDEERGLDISEHGMTAYST